MEELTRPRTISAAAPSWREDGLPLAGEFDDLYFSREGGLQETAYVFHAGNDLPDRWRGRAHFTIGELGFGTGLNFLATLRLWKQQRTPGARLSYISFEKHPLRRADLVRACALWPELSEESALLQEHYPPLEPGFHLIELREHAVRLILVFGDAGYFLPRLEAEVDAWFFDGFAPAKNPQLWTGALLTRAASASLPGATFSTFSAARAVREALTTAGWEWETVKGFGSKRHMLRGRLPDAKDAPTTPQSAFVIGAGVAGAAAAAALADRGLSVTVLDELEAPAGGASGNSSAVVMPYPTRGAEPGGAFYLAAFIHARTVIEQLRADGLPISGAWCGVLRLATNDRLGRVFEAIHHHGELPELATLLDADQIFERFGLRMSASGLHFPTAGWIRPIEYCKALLARAGGRPAFGKKVAALQRTASGWQARDAAGDILAEAEVAVVANSHSCRALSHTASLPLNKVRGQLTVVDPGGFKAPLVLCAEGYAVPESAERLLIGATYERSATDCTVDPKTDEALIARFKAHTPDAASAAFTIRESRAAFRGTTPDHLPCIGETADAGLYVSVGHGSRGMISAALAGEIIASAVAREPAPLDKELLRAVSPRRFTDAPR